MTRRLLVVLATAVGTLHRGTERTGVHDPARLAVPRQRDVSPRSRARTASSRSSPTATSTPPTAPAPTARSASTARPAPATPPTQLGIPPDFLGAVTGKASTDDRPRARPRDRPGDPSPRVASRTSRCCSAAGGPALGVGAANSTATGDVRRGQHRRRSSPATAASRTSRSAARRSRSTSSLTAAHEPRSTRCSARSSRSRSTSRSRRPTR